MSLLPTLYSGQVNVNSRNCHTVSIWSAILAASRHDWASNSQLARNLPAGELVIDKGGHWQTSWEPGPDESLLLDSLLPLAAVPGPLVIAQLGQSLDGRIATVSGDSHYINGPEARTHLHRLRALVDTVIIGVGTAIADRPRLTVRHVTGANPVRVVIDPSGRMPATGPLTEPGFGQTTVIHLVRPGLKLPQPPPHLCRIEMPTVNGSFCPDRIIELLHRQGLRRVLVEGGGTTISRFYEADALDRLHLLLAPLLIGSGRPGLELAPIEQLSQARRPAMRWFPLGPELLLDLDLRCMVADH